MEPNEAADKKFFITLGILLLLLMVGLGVLSTISKHKSSLAGELVISTSTTNDLPKSHPSFYPAFSGLSRFIDDGVTSDQVTGLKYAFYQYEQATQADFKKITVDDGSIATAPRDSNAPNLVNAMTFTVSIDGAPHKARMEYSGLSNITLSLYDQNNVTTYNSGTININTQTPKIN